jgi:hypothetical protein
MGNEKKKGKKGQSNISKLHGANHLIKFTGHMHMAGEVLDMLIPQMAQEPTKRAIMVSNTHRQSRRTLMSKDPG